MSLANRFLEAGATAVVASLWPVEDRAAAWIAVRFHRELTAGRPPAEALRRAQRAAREEELDPAAWAGFRVIGVH